jgi:hypothetical protein
MEPQPPHHTHITGVYAGAGAAAPYHRRAHAVRDTQVLLWEGEQLVLLVLNTDILRAHAYVHMSCARACTCTVHAHAQCACACACACA